MGLGANRCGPMAQTGRPPSARRAASARAGRGRDVVDEGVAETFESDLAKIQEQERAMHGEQRKFFSSVVDRIRNNVDVLKGLRDEHASMRRQLNDMTRRRTEAMAEFDLVGERRRQKHQLNYLKQQLDLVSHRREREVSRREDLERQLQNYRLGEGVKHPELERMSDFRNKLGEARVKEGEAAEMARVYGQIIQQFGVQQTLWNPILSDEQREVARREKDISELTMIARDSDRARHQAAAALRTAHVDAYEQGGRRQGELKRLHAELTHSSDVVSEESERARRAGPSVGSVPSQLRAKQSKQARERREERRRMVEDIAGKIVAAFGTLDADAVRSDFEERRRRVKILGEQADDLVAAIAELEAGMSQVRAELDELSYSTADGIGVGRLLVEGQAEVAGLEAQSREAQRRMDVFHEVERKVSMGVAHLLDALALILPADLPPLTAPTEIIDQVAHWTAYADAQLAGQGDGAWADVVNASAWHAMKARGGEEQVGTAPRTTTSVRRSRKDPRAGEIERRVQTREATKAAARRVAEAAAVKAKPPERYG